jgi:hypothetical protein
MRERRRVNKNDEQQRSLRTALELAKHALAEEERRRNERAREQEMTTTTRPKLYRVHSTLDDFYYRHWIFDGVEITWLAQRTAEERYNPPWTEVPVYDPETGKEDPYLAGAVDELFTHEEAQGLVDYIEVNRPELRNTRISEYGDMPIPHNHMGLDAIPLGGGVDQLVPRWEEDWRYPLDFPVSGYVDMRRYEPREREPYKQCAIEGCEDDGTRIFSSSDTDHLKAEDGWVHMCEAHHEQRAEEARAACEARVAQHVCDECGERAVSEEFQGWDLPYAYKCDEHKSELPF